MAHPPPLACHNCRNCQIPGSSISCWCFGPWQEKVIDDRGREFAVEFSKMIREDCNTKRKLIARHDHASNAIIERVHQIISQVSVSFKCRILRISLELANHKKCLLPCTMLWHAAWMHSVFGGGAFVPCVACSSLEAHAWQKTICDQQKWSKREWTLHSIEPQKHFQKMVKHLNLEWTHLWWAMQTGVCQFPDGETVKMEKGQLTDAFKVRNTAPCCDWLQQWPIPNDFLLRFCTSHSHMTF